MNVHMEIDSQECCYFAFHFCGGIKTVVVVYISIKHCPTKSVEICLNQNSMNKRKSHSPSKMLTYKRQLFITLLFITDLVKVRHFSNQ